MLAKTPNHPAKKTTVFNLLKPISSIFKKKEKKIQNYNDQLEDFYKMVKK
ncbi:hypothetical protein [Urechidicola croceus]|nr:hypothetical protein [Urechidicola croceus]